MKKSKSQRLDARRARRVLIFVAVAVVVVAAAITVISRQKSAARSAANSGTPTITKTSATAATSANHTYVTRRVAGQNIQIDTQTGQIKPLTPQEAQRLAAELAPMVDHSSEGLTAVRQADGSISMDLQGHYQSVAVARVNSDGTVDQSCVDNPDAAGKFFGINPKLIRDAQAAQRIKPNQAPN